MEGNPTRPCRRKLGHLLALDEWPVRTRQMTSIFQRGAIHLQGHCYHLLRRGKTAALSAQGSRLDIVWQGRQITGRVGMRDLGRMFTDNQPCRQSKATKQIMILPYI
jgi:hypothetical protein